jgi:hypothetical protein
VSETIESAWTPDVASWFRSDPDDVRLSLARGIDHVSYFLKGELPRLIALANAALPDNDPRKITRERLGLLAYANGRDELSQGEWEEVKAFVAALQSYLPPE